MKKNQKTNSKERFQELIGIIKIGLQDFRMQKDEPDKYHFRLGMFLHELKEVNKLHQYYETFSDLCRQELLISSNYAYKQIRCYKKRFFA